MPFGGIILLGIEPVSLTGAFEYFLFCLGFLECIPGFHERLNEPEQIMPAGLILGAILPLQREALGYERGFQWRGIQTPVVTSALK